MQAVILAAGIGSRLGCPFPKCLSELPNGERILGRQIRLLKEAGILTVHVVVGFKMTLIMEAFPDVFFCYNPAYYVTNTSKSLLCALRMLDDDVIWINGDVVFDPRVLTDLLAGPSENLVCVDKKRCGAEEVKYALDAAGRIREISKIVNDPQGEAVGINLVRQKSLKHFTSMLERCDELDYFEMGLEMMLIDGGVILPLDISAHRCIEVDFAEDWEAARRLFPE
ncbi:MAG: NTP transferase domain-containing protein [Solidesulfovibrio sp.]